MHHHERVCAGCGWAQQRRLHPLCVPHCRLQKRVHARTYVPCTHYVRIFESVAMLARPHNAKFSVSALCTPRIKCLLRDTTLLVCPAGAAHKLCGKAQRNSPFPFLFTYIYAHLFGVTHTYCYVPLFDTHCRRHSPLPHCLPEEKSAEPREHAAQAMSGQICGTFGHAFEDRAAAAALGGIWANDWRRGPSGDCGGQLT